MKKILILLLLSLFFLYSTVSVYAVNDPIKTPNNKFGIHITSESDLQDAANLVNTSGGDWGYVTIVITESERDHDRWQKVFNQMRTIHLIPIVRLATKPKADTWDAPSEAEINNWVAFLNNLNWVIQNRYVIINNEPNHALEWGGRIDPAGYANYLKAISGKLKEASPDFFILPAGLDPASANTAGTMTENKFLSQMLAADSDIFDSVDGWTSHAYPNARINIYEHELIVVNKKLPVFITETGWPSTKYTEGEIGENLLNAYKNTWNDPKVVAVTPFILNYASSPFDMYTWKKADSSFASFYGEVQKVAKIKGEPVQIESGQIFAAISEPVIFTGMDFVGAILAKNTGQTIWSKDTFSIGSESSDFNLKGFSVNNLEPGNLGLIFFRAAEAQNTGVYTNSLFLTGSKKQKITNSFSIEAGFINLGKIEYQTIITKILPFLNLGNFIN